MSIKMPFSLFLVSLLLHKSHGFTLSTHHTCITNTPSLSTIKRCNPATSLFAKNNKNKRSSGKGFGKGSTEVKNPNSNDSSSFAGGLTSIETSTSTSTPTSFARPKEIELDPNLSEDERNKEILKQKFGLKSFEEKQGDLKKAEKMAENKARMQQIKQMKDEEFDIMMIIPPPVVRAIDAFLKIGLAITTTLFILAGMGITAEAWSVATSNPLPEDVDAFIVNVIEPNFTPGLFVLLGFSVSLGVFATAQLGSGSSTYKEQ